MIKIISSMTKLLLTAIITLLFSSCNRYFEIGNGLKGSGNITTQTRPSHQDFTSIEVSENIKVIVEQADISSIQVETDDNLQSIISTKIENGILKIAANENYNAAAPIVSVKMPIIFGLKSQSGSEIKSYKVIFSNNLKVESSSGSTIDINVEADVITVESSSGSSIEVRGKALQLETTSSSGSEIDAKGLMANDVTSQSSSGSSTSIFPILKLNAKASSGSSIDYYKKPSTVAKNESSGGSVEEK